MAEGDQWLVTEDEFLSATVNADGELQWTRQDGTVVVAGVVVGPAVTDADMATILADPASASAAQLNELIPLPTQTPLPQQTNVVGFCGDSITNAAGASSNRGYVFLVRWVAGSRVVDQVPKIYATGGYTSAQVLATHVPSACAEVNLAVVHFAAGTNDAGTSVTAAQFGANVQAAYDLIVAAGKRMTISLIPPRGSGATAQWRRDRAAYNEWISRWAPLHGVPIADTSALVDPATGHLRADCDSGDGTHPNDLGHALIAQAVAGAVALALPKQPHRQIKAPDVNFALYGAPTAIASALPTGWSEISGGTGTAPVYSTVVDTTGTLKEGVWVQMDWDATTGGTRTFRTGSITKGTGWSPADQIEACVTLQVEDVNGFNEAVASGTASVRPVILTTANTVHTGMVAQGMRAVPGTHQAYRFPAPDTTSPAIGIEVTVPNGVHVKVRAAEVAWFNLTALGVTKTQVGTGTV